MIENSRHSKGLSSLGQRLRRARHKRGLTQEALAAPEFTKSYISAVERGHARPSLKALELLAGRLGMPISHLLADDESEETEVNLPALEEDLAYQVDCARRDIDVGRADAALALLNRVEHEYAPYWGQIKPYTRFRFHYGRAAAHIRLESPAAARADLELAQPLTEQFANGPEAAERVRNALGATFYQQDQPHQALELHVRCLHAIHTGIVQDLNLRLLIYSNLANDYLALNEIDRAISTYKESLKLLDDVSNLERQAGIYWGLSLAYKAKNDLAWARVYAARALQIHEARQNQHAVALMRINLAELHLARQEYEAAETLLLQACQVVENEGNADLLSRAMSILRFWPSSAGTWR